MTSAGNIIARFTDLIINPIILVVFALGFFLFVYGLVEFMWALRNGKTSDEGKEHMKWGLVGMFIMVSVYGIIALIDNTFGLNISNPDISRMDNVIPPQFR